MVSEMCDSLFVYGFLSIVPPVERSQETHLILTGPS
jgi:hypothetical protein